MSYEDLKPLVYKSPLHTNYGKDNGNASYVGNDCISTVCPTNKHETHLHVINNDCNGSSPVLETSIENELFALMSIFLIDKDGNSTPMILATEKIAFPRMIFKNQILPTLTMTVYHKVRMN